MTRLIDLPVGKYGRTQDGKYFKCIGLFEFVDELGHRVDRYFNEFASCEIVDGWPKLRAGQPFELTNKKLNGHPNERLMFQTNEGFRFIVETENYRMSIPFVFPTTDERLEWGSATWTASSGRIPHALKGNQLYLSYEKGKKPTLHVGLFSSCMTIPSQ